MDYVIFGAGDNGKGAIQILGRENIRFFIDNNTAKQENGFEGFDVLSVTDAATKIGDAKVAVAVSRIYEDEVFEQLKQNGIENVFSAAGYIYEARKKKLGERKDYIEVYNKSIAWIHTHTINNNGIAISSTESIIYPEVTGYYIPTLLRWGQRELAFSYARYLISVQREDGAWNGPHDNTPYVFDTGQIIKGLIAVGDYVENAIESAVKAADWILSNMSEEGRLSTPDTKEWGDGDSCSELIHLYCLSPLIELTRLTGKDIYEKAAIKISDYYLEHYYERIVQFRHLSHFHAYLVEALIDIGKLDIARIAMNNMETYQKENGEIPAYNNCEWVCSTGMFQLALSWFRLGDVEKGDKTFYCACNLQNETGGWYGSYVSDDKSTEMNNYFPLSEISWANKYFLDALYYKNIAMFNNEAGDFLDYIDITDDRYRIIKSEVDKINDGGLICEIGCGKGRYLKNLAAESNRHRYMGVDLSENVLSYIDDERILKKQGSLTMIPLGDNEADMAFACEALEHAVDITASVKELARVVKPGGIIVVIDKTKDKLGQMDIGLWEQWFGADALKNELLNFCDTVEVVDEISYEGLSSDGLFLAWIGKVV